MEVLVLGTFSPSIIITLSKSLIMTSKRANYRTCACREIKFPDAKLQLEIGIELKGAMAQSYNPWKNCKLLSHRQKIRLLTDKNDLYQNVCVCVKM